MSDLLNLLYRLKEDSVELWCNQPGSLSFSFDKKKGFDAELKKQLVENKAAVLEMLEFNQIDSEVKAKKTAFYQLPDAMIEKKISAIQRGILLQSHQDLAHYTYNIPIFIRLKSPRIQPLKKAMQFLLRQHPILRMKIVDMEHYELWAVDDFTVLHCVKTVETAEQYCQERSLHWFELIGGQLIQLELIHLEGTDDVIANLTHHHILSDALSVSLMVADLLKAYLSECQGVAWEANRTLNYLDYIGYQHYLLKKEDYKTAIQALAERLDQSTPLMLEKKTCLQTHNQAGHFEAVLGEEVCQKLRSLASAWGVSLYAILLTALYRILLLHSQDPSQPNFPVALTVSNRPFEFNESVGPFINTLPLMPHYEGGLTFLENAQGIHQEILYLNQYQQANLNLIAEKMQQGREHLAELTQVLFTFLNFKQPESMNILGSLGGSLLAIKDAAEKFGMSFIAQEMPHEINIVVTYLDAVYKPELVSNLLYRFIHCLKELDESARHTPMDQLNGMTKAERHQVLHQWNQTHFPFSDQQTIHQLFEGQVEKTPDAPAVIFGETTLTYQALNQKANQLAHYLKARYSIQPDEFICLCLNRSQFMLIGILAILKCGAAYVPMDPDYPQDRIEYIVQDTKAKVVIVDEQTKTMLSALFPDQLCLIHQAGVEWFFGRESTRNLEANVQSHHLAYVIYTSGTTGRPKGVLIEHAGLVNRIQWMNAQYPLKTSDKILQKTPYVFDVSVWELLWGVLYGACVVFARPQGHKEADYLIEMMHANDITICHFVPSMLSVFLNALAGVAHEAVFFPKLRYVFCSGEALTLNQVRKFKQQLPHIQLHNLYGPTEASIDVLYFDCNVPDLNAVYIGRPIHNTVAHILSPRGQPLPVGVVGELYIGGVGLARGYLNQPELTAEKFLSQSFLFGDGFNMTQRLYKTGDLARWTSDGNIEFLGRADFQVKLKGYRIELSEIETVLNGYPGVRESCVLVHDRKMDGDVSSAYLVAYYVSDQKLEEAAILKDMQKKLPEYMVPHFFVFMTAFPTTINGKLDRKKLSILAMPNLQNQGKCSGKPASLQEDNIRVIWSELLGLPQDKIGLQDDFFKLGGDSILSIQLVSLLRQRLGLELKVKDIFNQRSIEAIAKIAEQRQQEQASDQSAQKSTDVLSDVFPLLPIQSWFFEQAFLFPSHWNQSFLIKTGLLDVNRLKQSVHTLLNRHDVFKVRYRQENGEFIQCYDLAFTQNVEIPVLDVKTWGLAEGSEAFEEAFQKEMTRWQSDFDLDKGPLYRFAYIHGFDDGSARIFFAAHHLIVDAVSWRIISQELKAIYDQAEKGSSRVVSVPYQVWVKAVHRYAQVHSGERDDWEGILSKGVEADFRGIDINACSESAFELSLASTRDLLANAHQAFHTQINDLLLSALAMALHSLTGRNSCLVTLEGHGREEIDSNIDLTSTVGWFTTLYPIFLENKPELVDTVKLTKETLREIPDQGIGYGALIGYKQKLPSLCFNYLGQFDSKDKNRSHGDWTVLPMSAGQSFHPLNQPSYAVNILGWIEGGIFKCHIKTYLPDISSNAFSKQYRESLLILLNCLTSSRGCQYTPSDFKAVRNEAGLSALPLISQQKPFDWFEMTEIQKAYLIGRLGEYEIGNVANHIYHEYHYPVSLQIERLVDAVRTIIKEENTLRTIFSFETLKQRILSEDEAGLFDIALHDFSGMEYQEIFLKEIRARLTHKVYDPEQFPLFTFEVSQFKNHAILHISMDLILMDVQSRQAFFKKLDRLYRGNSTHDDLPPQIDFKDYQDYSANLNYSSWYAADKAYWQAKIHQMPGRPELSFKVHPSSVLHPTFNTHTLYVEKDIWGRFKAKADAANISYSSALLALYGHVIAYFSGNREFLITLTLFNRYAIHPDVEKIWGDFTSTLLFHFKDVGQHLNAVLKRTHEELWEDVDHALYSGVQVQRDLMKLKGWDQFRAVSPIVFTGVIGNQTRYFDDHTFLDDREHMESRHWTAQTSQAWIDLQAIEVSGAFMSKWLYVEQLFAVEYISKLNHLYCRLITWLSEHDWHDLSAEEIDYLPKQDFSLIQAANANEQIVEKSATLFEHHAAIAKNEALVSQLAVIEGGTGRQFTHGQLYEDSLKIAKFLRAHLLKDHPLVAVLSEKGYAQVVSVYGILRAGLAYLPLNVDWPLARVLEIVEQAGVGCLLASSDQFIRIKEEQAGFSKYQIYDIEKILLMAGQAEETENLSLTRVSPDALAYVIFTSGSTGKPKGVAISHQAALNTIQSVNDRFKVGFQDRVLALSELSFDLSVYDIFGLLSVGGCVVFPDPRLSKDSGHWLDLIQTHQVTLWNTVPQLAGLLMEEMLFSQKQMPWLRLFLLSGDWIPLTLPDQIKSCCQHAEVVSLGGATEGSIWSIWFFIQEVKKDWLSIPYGHAMPNQKMYVLDESGRHSPVGVPGEIYIGGVGVAMNYWQDTHLTQARFIHHPTLGRIYKTGDWGRWCSEGYIEFIGRQDGQVKIRGYRVELAEIEAGLLAFEGVKASWVVLDKESQHLLGYYVAEKEINEVALFEFLQRRLPEYMMPFRLVYLKAFPLTANGKLDRNALPKPMASIQKSPEEKALKSPLEEKICELWSHILELDKETLDVNDDFFRLGGDSISSIRMISQVRWNCGVHLTLKDVFSHRTVKRLAALVAEKTVQNSMTNEQDVLTGDLPLLPIQQWFFQSQFINPHFWNQAVLIKTPPLDVEKLEACLQALVQYHDVLRLRFSDVTQRPVQRYANLSDMKTTLKVLDITTWPVKEGTPEFEAKLYALLTQWQGEFNLIDGPIHCVGYLSGFREGSSRIFFAVHHLAVDVVSFDVMRNDLKALYEGQSLGVKGTSFRQWSQALQASTIQVESEAYWQTLAKKLQAYQMIFKPWLTGLPAEKGVVRLDEVSTQHFLKRSHAAYQTQANDILLTALGLALKELTGQPEHVVMLEGHGRDLELGDLNVLRTVGWFTTLYPVCLEMPDEIGQSIRQVKETLRSIPHRGAGYGLQVGYHLPFPVAFNYLGRLDKKDQTQLHWDFTDEACGRTFDADNILPQTLNMVGKISHGCLEFAMEGRLQPAILIKFSSIFKRRLEEVILHTVELNRSYLTPSDTNYLLDQMELDHLQKQFEIENVYLANSLQQGFIYHALSQGDTDDAYRVQAIWTYQNLWQPELLKQAWSVAQQKYPALRVGFTFGEKLLQVIRKKGFLNWQLIDLTGVGVLEQNQKINHYQQIDRGLAYDLSQGCLFRVYLIKQKEDLYTCILNMHHAIADGWSTPILLAEVHRIYLNLMSCPEIPVVPDLAYAKAQAYLQAHEEKGVKAFEDYLSLKGANSNFSSLLKPEHRLLNLQDYKQVVDQQQKSFTLNGDDYLKLKSVSQTFGVTVNAILQYLWHKVLSLYGDTDQTIVGTVVSLRNLPVQGIEDSVGLYINTLPLVVNHDEDEQRVSFIHKIREVQEGIHFIQQHNCISLSRLQKKARRLFDSLFMFGNYPVLASDASEGSLKLTFKEAFEKRDYPLVVSVDVEKDSLMFKLDYAADIFSSDRIHQLLETLKILLNQVIHSPEKPLSDLTYLSQNDEEKIIFQWNLTQAYPSKSETIHSAIEQYAMKSPHAIAVAGGHAALTYCALNRQANQMARLIKRKLDLMPESRIAICLNQTPFLLVAILAVLKLGCAYVPIDPGYPASRKMYILRDSESKGVITEQAYQEDFDIFKILVDQAPWIGEKEDNLSTPVHAHQLAYLVYTSGTTGLPKGVMIEHQSVMVTLSAIQKRYFPNQAKINTYSLTRFVFDIFGLEYGLPLTTGGQLTLGQIEFQTLDASNYDFIQMTPSVCELKLDAIFNASDVLLLVGGESLSRHLLEKALARFSQVVNVYGPSETTIWSTSKHYQRNHEADWKDQPVSIGKPLDGERVYILDKYLRPLPVGVMGELCIGGMGVGRGYLNQSALTLDKFKVNPFLTDPNLQEREKRLYKTGDFARWFDNGDIEFIGRKDFQVKVRGHRIELVEVESALLKCEGVSQSLVVVSENQDALVAYCASPVSLRQEVLQARLKAELPDYMVPNQFVFLPTFPLNENGKIDRKALPKPSIGSEHKRSAVPVQPAYPIQEELLSIWKALLSVEHINIEDNFFDLGGTSITLIKLFAKLPAQLRDILTFPDLFKYPTIAALTKLWAGTFSTDSPSLGQVVPEVSLNAALSEGIAIIGMAGRFPGAENLDQFWENLKGGVEATQYYTVEELAAAGVSETLLKNPFYVRAQSVLDDFKCFDAEFFHYTPREAACMDPQHRLLMECVWHALEDAHCNPEIYQGKIGLFAGAGQNHYFTDHVLPSQPCSDLASQYQMMLHHQANFLSTKIAYKLNLTGPAITIQTACSTSLVAVHQACNALRVGDCEVAIAGGVSVGKLEKEGYLYQPGLIFSPDGKCRAFDENAEGTFEGQGVGVVILKPLAKALQEGDRIYAVIKSSAINNDGKEKIGYTAPSAQKQAEVIQATHRKAGIEASTIGYIEAHGTGTRLGDPIEIEGLTQAFLESTNEKNFCAIGSVKTNVGHLDVAAGITGLIKTALCLFHQHLVPSLHYQSPNPQIHFEDTPFYVIQKPSAWVKTPNVPRRAGVSSFGIGGTNAHVLLEEVPCRENPVSNRPQPGIFYVFNLSAPSLQALKRQIDSFLVFLASCQEEDLARIAYTLHQGRKSFAFHYVVVANSISQLNASLKAWDQASVIQRQAVVEDKIPVSMDADKTSMRYKDQLHTLGALWARGALIDWKLIYGQGDIQKIPLPLYPFEKKPHWFSRVKSQTSRLPENSSTSASKNHSLHEKLVDIWKNILGLNEVDLNADFFELGGDSLSAVELQTRLKQEFGASIQLMTLKKITCSDIIAKIQAEQFAVNTSFQVVDKPLMAASPSIVTLNQGEDSRLPLILIHPIGGDIYFYRDLVKTLSDEQTVYAIRSPMLDRDDITLDSIEAISGYYLGLLDQSKIKPPYVLGGSSFGGIVAYHMAQLLSQKEAWVPWVVLLDSPGYGNLPSPMTDNQILEYLIKYGLKHLSINLTEWDAQKGLEGKIRYLADKAKQSDLKEILSETFLPVYIKTWQTHGVAMRKYIPQSYKGSVLFFSHTEMIDEFPSCQELTWQPLVGEKFWHHKVPGNHITMNQYPNISVAGEILASLLESLLVPSA